MKQRHSSSGKCKSKPQWDTTSHLSEWLKSTNVGEDVEEKGPSCTVGGNEHWCRHCGKWYRPGGHYAQGNESERERQMSCDFTYT